MRKREGTSHRGLPAPRLRRLVLATLACLAAGTAWAQPGRLIDLTPMESLTPAQIDAVVSGPFRNDGETPPTAAVGVDSYLMTFEARWPDGRLVEAVAELNVPRTESDEAILFTFTPGSTGLVEACAPSRGFADGGARDTYGRYTLAYAGQGFVSVMPNYLGFFEVGVLQPYFVREAEGRLALDASKAARAALEELGSDLSADAVFIGGYSQGGHAAFAAADLAADHAPDLPLRGILGFGPSGELATLFQDFTYVAPWVLYAWQSYYPDDAVDPADVLLGGYANALATDAERLCIAGVQTYYPSTPEGLYTPEFAASLRDGTLAETHPVLADLFARNDAGLAGHGLPVMVLQGVDDPVVPLHDQHRHVAAMCDAGSRVRYANFVRTRHETRYLGFEPAMDWMRSLAEGRDAPSDCESVPRP